MDHFPRPPQLIAQFLRNLLMLSDHSLPSHKGKKCESQTDLAERIFATQRSKNTGFVALYQLYSRCSQLILISSTRRERPPTSTSSYAQSSLSSSFTLSSNTTDDSSANSALFERERKETGNNAFAVELKRLYRGITCLEGKITQQDSEFESCEEGGRVLLKGRPGKEVRDEDAEQQKRKKVIHNHKQ